MIMYICRICIEKCTHMIATKCNRLQRSLSPKHVLACCVVFCLCLVVRCRIAAVSSGISCCGVNHFPTCFGKA